MRHSTSEREPRPLIDAYEINSATKRYAKSDSEFAGSRARSYDEVSMRACKRIALPAAEYLCAISLTPGALVLDPRQPHAFPCGGG